MKNQEFEKISDMVLVTDDLIKERTEVIQQIIELSKVHGSNFLQSVKETASRFKPHPKTFISPISYENRF